MPTVTPDHYATLGLHPCCTDAEIRTAYRILARQCHPDAHPGAPPAPERMQALNAAHAILSHPARRQAYDQEREAPGRLPPPRRVPRAPRELSQDVYLRIGEFLRGTTLEVRVNDPANPSGPEMYPLTLAPGTAPGKCFRLPRTGSEHGGFVRVRLRVRPDFRFKVRGSDLRCDLRLTPQRAAQGGSETVSGPEGSRLRVDIPRGVGRGAILRLPGEGLPKPRGGRGDLLVRIDYRTPLTITRKSGPR